ncbi:histidine kinase [Methylorubrum sp. SB2]|uniref:histidine kinase n=1 Tax=Methylorubrum subtropicum TaxID=3138812 RepID=UPI00313BF986
MRLLPGLVLRFVGVAMLCLAATSAWVLFDAHRSIQAQAAASADRVVRVLQSHVWLGSAHAAARLASPNWQTAATLREIAPTVCVSFLPAGEAPQRLCSDWAGYRDSAPRWFETFYDAVFGESLPVTRPLIIQRKEAGLVVASPLPEAAMRQAWHEVLLATGAVFAAVVGFSVLAFLILGHALRPGLTIIRGLKALGGGRTDLHLPRFGASEFRLIAEAVEDLAERLAHTNAERLRLTRQLLQIQEDERRLLARELHDEFGQCLTATSALAASIEMGAAERPDLASDAVAIGTIASRMMGTLRDALGRLRPPDFDEIGLGASLDQLIQSWNLKTVRKPVFSLSVRCDLSVMPASAALNVYRIVQECLTNAVRHGTPDRVQVSLTGSGRTGEAISVVVEDDGGGDPARIANASGFGILGIRERVAALGGRLAIARAEGGIRVAALIPLTTEPLCEAA